MTLDRANPGKSDPTSAGSLIDRICDRFESAWRSGVRPAIEDFLAEGKVVDDGHITRTLLLELVMIDLECRWLHHVDEFASTDRAVDTVGSGEAEEPGLPPLPRVEDYLRRFPELGPPGDTSPDLIACEYRARRRRGIGPIAMSTVGDLGQGKAGWSGSSRRSTAILPWRKRNRGRRLRPGTRRGAVPRRCTCVARTATRRSR